MRGIDSIAAERERQVTEEGWTADHDDTHGAGELAWAAACYAAPERILRHHEGANGSHGFVEPWPTETHRQTRYADDFGSYRVGWPRPDCSRIEQLAKAGALIAAEIDRLERADAQS
jgi:hypothetical protein